MCIRDSVKGDPLDDGEGAVHRVDADQRREGRRVGIVDGEHQSVLGIIGQFVRTKARGAIGGDVAHRLAVAQIDRDDAAVGVGHKEPGKRRDDAVGPGGGVGSGEALERRRGADLGDQLAGSRIHDIDDGVGAIGEIIGLRRLIDKADVEHVHLAAGGVRLGSRNGNRLQQMDRPVPPVALPRGCGGCEHRCRQDANCGAQQRSLSHHCMPPCFFAEYFLTRVLSSRLSRLGGIICFFGEAFTTMTCRQRRARNESRSFGSWEPVKRLRRRRYSGSASACTRCGLCMIQCGRDAAGADERKHNPLRDKTCAHGG